MVLGHGHAAAVSGQKTGADDAAVRHRPVNRAALLAALAEVESRNNPHAVGPAGERGLWQFRLGTWRQHTSAPFAWAHEPAKAREIAEKHLEWLRQAWVKSRGREPTARELAATWNGGVSLANGRKWPPCVVDYCERVAALYTVRTGGAG